MQNSEILDYARVLIFPTVLAIPSILVILIGLGISVSRRKEYPKISLLVIIALSIDLFLKIFYIFQPMLSYWLSRSGTNVASIGNIFGVIGIVTSIISAISLGILIYAVWARREK